jgi:excisionase family DNA binding protein
MTFQRPEYTEDSFKSAARLREEMRMSDATMTSAKIDDEIRLPVAKLHRLTEAAKLLGIPRKTVWQMVRRGDLAAVRLGRTWYIPSLTINALLADRSGLGVANV